LNNQRPIFVGRLAAADSFLKTQKRTWEN